jgi:hypothetical protein
MIARGLLAWKKNWSMPAFEDCEWEDCDAIGSISTAALSTAARCAFLLPDGLGKEENKHIGKSNDS